MRRGSDMIRFEICDKGEAEYEGSRFFGDPVIPEKWADAEPWDEEDIFMCQINLSDLVGHDTGGLLPEEGYLYFFADVSEGIRVHPLLSLDEPDTIYEDCNLGFEDETSDDIFTDWVIRFGEGDGTVLASDGGRVVLLEFDPCSTRMDFKRDIGGRIRVSVTEAELRSGDFSNAMTDIV